MKNFSYVLTLARATVAGACMVSRSDLSSGLAHYSSLRPVFPGSLRLKYNPFSWLVVLRQEHEDLSLTSGMNSEGVKKSEDYKPFFFKPEVSYAIAAILNSSLFYWFWHIYSDGFHCGYKDVRAFRLGDLHNSRQLPILQSLGKRLMVELRQSTKRKSMISKSTGRIEYDEFNPRTCLDIIRDIDVTLAQHYGFSDEELDYIVNFDTKYRMGEERGNEEEE